jgi:acetyl esterase/lipase
MKGSQVARALAARGPAAFVLKYRLIQTPPDMAAFQASMAAMFSGAARPQPRSRDGFGDLAPQLADSRAAFALIRRRAAEWRVDPNRVGMIGFSAGAMLTMSTALAGGDSKPAFIAWLGTHGLLTPPRQR